MGTKKATSSINIEHVTKATDKRGGHLVNFCRSTVRGRQGQTRWKDIRFVDGKFENWPGRWEVDQLPEFMTNISLFIEKNHKALDAGNRVDYRPPITKPGDLTRDIEALG